MAKKQKKELSPEERLAAARVPEEEWPYKLPEGWEWVRLEGIIDEIKNGTTIKQDKSGNGVSVTRIESLQNQTIDFSRLGTIVNEEEIKDSDWYRVGDIALSHINSADHVGKTALITREMLPLVHGMNLLRLRFGKYLLPKLFQLYSQSLQYKEAVIERINRAVNQVSINQKQIKSIPFPLPPLEIQQQIVVNIESLFAKLDQAEEKALQTLATAETRKAAILHQAFTGQLTEKWRAENGVAIESWETLTLNDCGEWNGGGTPSMQHDEYWENGNIPWITSKDMKSNLIEDTLMHVNMVGVENSSAKLIEKPSLLFVTRSGILRRMLPIAMVKKAFTVNQDLKVLTPSEEINLDYLFWACRAKEREILATCMKSGTTVESINFSALKQVEIPIPSLEEQKHIALVLDFLLEDEGNFRKKVIEVIDSCDATKKAILAKAFRGEWQQRP